MVSTADVKPGAVTAEVASSVVISNVAVSNIRPVVVEPRVVGSAKVVSMEELSTEVVPRVVVSAEVVSKVVISAEVVPRLVICDEVVVVPAVVIPGLDVSNTIPVELTEGVVSAELKVNGISKSILVLFNVVCSVCVGVLDESVLWVVSGVFSNSSQGRVGMASKSERSKSVPNSTSAAAVVLVILPGCVDTLEASTFMVVPIVISGGLKETVFILLVGSGYKGVLDGSILGVVLGVSSNSPRGRVGMTLNSERSKPVPNSISAAAGLVVLVIIPGCVDTMEASDFSVVPRVISGGLKGVVFLLVVGSGYKGVLDVSILVVFLGVSSNSPQGTVGVTSKYKRPKSVPNSTSA